jgi:hypothetical protein
MKTNRRFFGFKAGVVLGMGVLFFYIMHNGFADHDFFSQYYVGRGVAEGARMYGDFSDNKGPVLYLFFAGLSFVFGESINWALIGGNLLLWLISILGLVELARYWQGKGNISKIGEMVFLSAMGLYLGATSCGGIYAENVGMAFLIWSLIFVSRRLYFWAGLLFAGAFFSRQTICFFLPYLIYSTYILGKNNFKKSLLKLFYGGGLVSLLVLGGLIFTGDLGNFIHNAIVFNINYAAAVNNIKWDMFLLFFVNGNLPQLFIVAVLSVLVGLLIFWKRQTGGVEFVILAACSLGSIFSGGIFYLHHLAQFSLVVGFSVGALVAGKEIGLWKTMIIGLILAFSMDVGIDYARYKNEGKSVRLLKFMPSEADKINQKKYLMVISFNPRLYFDYDKRAPDKYFQPFFWSEFYNTEAKTEAQQHLDNMRLKFQDTAFVYIKDDWVDEILIKEYFDNFGDEFGLTKVGSGRISDKEIEIFWAGSQ